MSLETPFFEDLLGASDGASYDTRSDDDDDTDVDCGQLRSSCRACVYTTSSCKWCPDYNHCVALEDTFYTCGSSWYSAIDSCPDYPTYSAWGLWTWTVASLAVSVVFALLLYCLCTLICFPPKPMTVTPRRRVQVQVQNSPAKPAAPPPSVIPVYVYEPVSAQQRFMSAPYYATEFAAAPPPARGLQSHHQFYWEGQQVAYQPVPSGANITTSPGPNMVPAPNVPPATTPVPAPAVTVTKATEDPSRKLQVELDQLRQQHEEDKRSCIDLQSRNEELRDRVTWLNLVVEKKSVAETARPAPQSSERRASVTFADESLN